MIPLVMETILEHIQRKPFPWVDDQPTEDDLDHILKQTADSFDVLKLKDSMVDDLRKGKVTLVTKSGPYAKVLALVYPRTEIPWEAFGEIFSAFGPPKGKEPWRIVWFANPTKRQLPAAFEEPGPEHLNGGYTYPCNNDTIVIYREEEVCRVLVHELLHASCSDDQRLDVIDQEAATETWAELFLVAIRGKTRRDVAGLWANQAQWIADQEHVLRTKHNVNSKESYAWRYTVARRHVLEGLGISLPPPCPPVTGNSLRFTHAGV